METATMPLKTGSRLNVKRLVEVYVNNYLKVAGELNPGERMQSDKFYGEVYRGVRAEIPLSEGQTIRLHHPFHWTVFSDINGSSPVEQQQELSPDGRGFHVALRRPINETDRRVIADGVLKKYGDYLEANLKVMGLAQ